MDPQQWLNELRTELQKRRLPRRYVMRLMRELSDHVTDEWEKPMNKDDQRNADPLERLGMPQGVAETAEQEYCAPKFAARHPLWTFGVFPPLLFLVLAIGLYMVFAPLFESLTDLVPLATRENSAWAPVLAQGFLVGCIVLASLAVTITFAMVARMSALKRQWPMTAAIVTGILCGCLWTDVTQKTPEQMGRVTIGISGSLRPSKLTFPQLFQFAVPLAVAAWMTRGRSSTDDPAMKLRSVT